MSYADSAVWQQWVASGAQQFSVVCFGFFFFAFFCVVLAAYLADIVSVSGGLAARYESQRRRLVVLLPSCLLVFLSRAVEWPTMIRFRR